MLIEKMLANSVEKTESKEIKHLYNQIRYAVHLQEKMYLRKIVALKELADAAGKLWDFFADDVVNDQGPEEAATALKDYMRAVRFDPYISNTFYMDCCEEENLLGWGSVEDE